MPADEPPKRDEPTPRRSRPPAPRFDPEAARKGKAAFLRVWKTVALGVGGLLALVSLGAPAPQAAVIVGVACFLGISARIIQAEEHRAADK